MLKHNFGESTEEQICMPPQFYYTDDNYISIVEKPSLSRIFSTFSSSVHQILTLHVVKQIGFSSLLPMPNWNVLIQL